MLRAPANRLTGRTHVDPQRDEPITDADITTRLDGDYESGLTDDKGGEVDSPGDDGDS
jgi:hypothetical protein